MKGFIEIEVRVLVGEGRVEVDVYFVVKSFCREVYMIVELFKVRVFKDIIYIMIVIGNMVSGIVWIIGSR